jgi:CelD/BcsL family acetyltransferase involved in cellulose biosynthesis
MEFAVITSEMALAAITQEWGLLRNRVARFPFADPFLFSAWWQIRGKQGGRKLHIVTGRQDGKLMAVAPLVVTRRWGIRVLEWGGSEAFDYCDTLLEAKTWGEPLWDAIRRSGLYDFALLRDVHPLADCSHTIDTIAQRVRSRPVAEIRFRWPTSSLWMSEALSTSTRAYFRRAERRLSQHGPLRFEVCRHHPLPTRVLDALRRQKTEWLQAHEQPSWLSDDPVNGASLLNEIALTAADAGDLHLCWLECGNEIIATHLGFEHHGLLHWYLPSYAMEWAKFAPGRFLLLKLIGWAIDHGLSGFDFMRGEEAYKAALANDQHDVTDFIFASPHIARVAERSLIAWYLRRQAGAAEGERWQT